MNPALVLNDDDKRRRFKKFHSLTVDGSSDVDEPDAVMLVDGEDEIDDIQIIEDITPTKHLSPFELSGSERENKRQKLTHENKKCRSSSKCSTGCSSSLTQGLIGRDRRGDGSSTSKRNSRPFPWNLDETSESEVEDLLFPLPNEVISDESDHVLINSLMLDPETGLVQDTLFCTQSSTIKENHSSNCIKQHNSPTKDELEKTISNTAEDDQIFKYIHKKFRKKVPIVSHQLDDPIKHQPSKDTGDKQTNKKENGTVSLLRQIRKSVIFKKTKANQKVKTVKKFKNINHANNRTLSIEKDRILISLSINEIKNFYTTEEENFMKRSFADFTEKWRAISFGEEFVSLYTNFAETRHTLSPRFFDVMNSTLRERMLHVICSGEDMDSFCSPTQFSILKANLSEATMLVQVMGFNMTDKVKEMDFIFTDKDMNQFRARPPGVEEVKIDEILKYAPFPEDVKRTLYKLLMSCIHHILGDTQVFSILIMLIVFKGDNDPLVKKINDKYWTMLRRHLTNKTASGEGVEDVEDILFAIRKCLQTLPIMARFRNQ